MFIDYLKPEYANTQEAKEIAELFEEHKRGVRLVLRVPVDVGDAITRWLKKAVKPEYHFFRRCGGGPRRDLHAQTCLRKDATYFRYYFDRCSLKEEPNEHQRYRSCSLCGRGEYV